MKATVWTIVLFGLLAACGQGVDPQFQASGAGALTGDAGTVATYTVGPGWTYKPLPPLVWTPETARPNTLWRSPPQELGTYPVPSGATFVEIVAQTTPGWAPVDVALLFGGYAPADGTSGYTDAAPVPFTDGGMSWQSASGNFQFSDATGAPLDAGFVTALATFDCSGDGPVEPCSWDTMNATITVRW